MGQSHLREKKWEVLSAAQHDNESFVTTNLPLGFSDSAKSQVLFWVPQDKKGIDIEWVQQTATNMIREMEHMGRDLESWFCSVLLSKMIQWEGIGNTEPNSSQGRRDKLQWMYVESHRIITQCKDLFIYFNHKGIQALAQVLYRVYRISIHGDTSNSVLSNML